MRWHRRGTRRLPVIRARRVAEPDTPLPPVTRRRDRPTKPNGLTKQTYSAVVQLPGMHKPRKWHLVSYTRVSRAAYPHR